MSTLGPRVCEYLTIRRALGYKLSQHERLLDDFSHWFDDSGASVVTSELALTWALSRPTSSPVRQRQRLSVVRGFTEYLSTIDPRTEVPARDLLPARYYRTAPYIYSTAEIAALMTAAQSLAPELKAATYQTLIGLLACTGMRYGEAAGLDRDDVSLAEASLLVRAGKNGRSRHVPVLPSTVAALSAYAAKRDELCPDPLTCSFFVSTRGGHLAASSSNAAFAQLRRLTGLDGGGQARLPRQHDLRHSFIVNTMLGWYRDDVDVQARLPLLSTYVGHVDPQATYWYQQAAPELLALAARRLETAPKDGP
jgi:integrase/recombinase XerD